MPPRICGAASSYRISLWCVGKDHIGPLRGFREQLRKGSPAILEGGGKQCRRKPDRRFKQAVLHQREDLAFRVSLQKQVYNALQLSLIHI